MSNMVGAVLSSVYGRYLALVQGLVDAAVVVDHELRPLAWNAAYAQAVGVRGRRLAKLISAPGIRCHNLFDLEVCNESCLVSRCFATKRFVRMDEIHGGSRIVARPDDSALGAKTAARGTYIVTAVPLTDEAGEVLAVLEIYRDVTAEVRIQERYKAMIEQERHRTSDLAREVQARTAELERSLAELRATRMQLIHSEKLSSLGQLVAGIAHEINNPINFIYGNTDFLRSYVGKYLELIHTLETMICHPEHRRRIDELKEQIEFDYMVEDTEKLVSSIRSGAERAAGIIRDLRSFIHGGSDRREEVDLEHCLETTLNLVSHQARGRIKIVREYARGLPPVLANEGQLNQVFMNLIMNAIHAIVAKGTITVRLAAGDGGVIVQVSDDGVGISEADQLKIFDPFFTTKPVGQGVGLGLSISYSVVDAHGGKLSVESRPGCGATFSVWLPSKARDP